MYPPPPVQPPPTWPPNTHARVQFPRKCMKKYAFIPIEGYKALDPNRKCPLYNTHKKTLTAENRFFLSKKESFCFVVFDGFGFLPLYKGEA